MTHFTFRISKSQKKPCVSIFYTQPGGFLPFINGLVGAVQVWRDYKISVIQIEHPGGCLKFLAPFAKGRVTLPAPKPQCDTVANPAELPLR